uniref:Glycosyltransferase family 32 protein n=1 Tax=Macrostomum lignano TaxID=282301 RepID=A0A1I8JD60_9PLAT
MARVLFRSTYRFKVVALLTALLVVAILAYNRNTDEGPPELDFRDIAIPFEPHPVTPGAIPKIIHQTFTTRRVFTEYRKHIEHCLKLNPDWEYYLWTDKDIVAFINDHYPFFMRKFLIFKMHVQRADSIRYMVLHHYGGIYIDMDVECVKPFFPSLENLTAFVDQEAKEHAVILYGKDFSAMNSAMGSVPGHPFFLRLVFAMMEVDDKTGGAGPTTGPDLLTSQLQSWWTDNATRRHEVTLLDPPVFSPLIDDGLHHFRSKCRTLESSSPKSTDAAAKRLHDRRLQLCRRYAERNWKHDLTGPETVGRHLFLHLGYRWSKRRPNYFDIAEVTKDVKFYIEVSSAALSHSQPYSVFLSPTQPYSAQAQWNMNPGSLQSVCRFKFLAAFVALMLHLERFPRSFTRPLRLDESSLNTGSTLKHCLKLNPDWEYFLWTDKDIVAFINDHYPFFMRKFLIFKMHVQRGDSIRYMVLHHYGGIYIDMDVECVKPFFPSLENLTAFVDQEAKEHAVILYGKDFSAMNSAMGSVPGHPFFLRLVFAMMEVDDKTGGAGPTTGPDLLTSQLQSWWTDNATRRHEVTLLDPPVFSPLIDDGLHHFRSKCRTLESSSPKSTDAAAKRLHDRRLQLCRRYAERNWKHDLTGPETVGRHLFLHLGYRWSKRRPNYFDIAEVTKDVKFYSQHKSSMSARKRCAS